MTEEKVLKPSLKPDTPAEAFKKVKESVEELAKPVKTPTKPTTKAEFLKRLNAEKDPVKKRLLMQVLKGRMFD